MTQTFNLLTVLSVLLSTSAFAEVLVDTTFATTFSTYSYTTKQFLTCEPGYRGVYATGDTLMLQAFTLDWGLSTQPQSLFANSNIGLENDPPGSHGRRPYDAGCKPAIEKFLASIANKDVVNVSVKRRVEKWVNSESIAQRNIKGDVLGLSYHNVEVLNEFFNFDLGGFTFSQAQSINLKSSDL